MSDPKSPASMTRQDFLTSIVLIAFSISVIVMSYTMPRLEYRGIDPLSAPGIVPGFIGVILLILSLILFFRSIKNGGYSLLWARGENKEPGYKGAGFRVLLTLVLCLVYAIGFLGRLNYFFATTTFIFGFICLFELEHGQDHRTRIKIIGWALLQAVVAALLVTLIFQKLFLVDLP
jgi:putative tricarboxylic transport membrane protein